MTMTISEEKVFINDFVGDIKKRINEMREELRPKGIICGQNWIIQIGSIFITPEFSHDTGKAMKTGKCTNGEPHRVMRFVEEDAVNLAKTTKNGSGVVGKAVIWVDGVQEVLTGLEEQYEMFKKHPMYEETA